MTKSKRAEKIIFIVFAVFFTLLTAAFVQMGLEFKENADGKEMNISLSDLLDKNKAPVGSYVTIDPPLEVINISPFIYTYSSSVNGYAFSAEGFPSVVFYADDDEDVAEELEKMLSSSAQLTAPVSGRIVIYEYGSGIPSGIEDFARGNGAEENVPVRIVEVASTKSGEMLPGWLVFGAAALAALFAFSFWSAVARSRRKENEYASKA